MIFDFFEVELPIYFLKAESAAVLAADVLGSRLMIFLSDFMMDWVMSIII